MNPASLHSSLSLADRIRQHVLEEIIEPARKAGRSTVTVRSGDVHSELGLKSRMPAVCSALDAQVFCEENHLRLVGARVRSRVQRWNGRLPYNE